jgi:ABC-type branched-subunit amino acid transport system substrate-binding protein
MNGSHKRLKCFPVLLALSLAGVLASCSSTTPSGSGATPSGTPIKIGIVGTFQAPSFAFPEVQTVALAFAKKVNQTGGLRGRPVDIVVCNDQFDPNVAASCARQMVSANVVAVVPGAEGYGNNLIPILANSGIPYVGGSPSEPADYTSPVAFPIDGGTYGDNIALGDYMAKNSCKKGGGVDIAGAPASALVVSVFQKALQANGSSLVATAGIAFNAPDVSAAVATLTSAGAQCVVLSLDPADAQKVVTAIGQSGHQVPIGAEWPQLTPYLANPSTAPNGLLTVQTNEVYGVNQSQGLTTYGKFISQYAPSVNPSLVWAENTYVAMSVVTGAIGQIPSGKGVTAATVLNQLKHTTSADTGGIAPKVDFTKQFSVSGYNRLFGRVAQIYEIENGRIVYRQSIDVTP